MTKYLLLLLAILISFTSCKNAKPLPKDKESFISGWKSYSGFYMVILPSGTATISQIANANDPEYDKLNIKVAPLFIKDMIVEFKGDSVLSFAKPMTYAKEYTINKNPYTDGDTTKLVLNGVIFIKQKY